MSEIKDGGPAFPAPWHPEMGWSPREAPPGMCLRDWFAGQALPAVLAFTAHRDDDGDAAIAYAIADAMLKAREIKP